MLVLKVVGGVTKQVTAGHHGDNGDTVKNMCRVRTRAE